MPEVDPDIYEWARVQEQDLYVLGRNVTELATRFARPSKGYILSMRLNEAESKALGSAARFHGEKLSVWIKRVAMTEAMRPQVKEAMRPQVKFEVHIA